MATDFDFDGTFNEDLEDEEEFEDEEFEDEGGSGGGGRRRLFIIVGSVIGLLLLCVICSFVAPMLGIPGLGGGGDDTQVQQPPPTQDVAVQPTTEGTGEPIVMGTTEATGEQAATGEPLPPGEEMGATSEPVAADELAAVPGATEESGAVSGEPLPAGTEELMGTTEPDGMTPSGTVEIMMSPTVASTSEDPMAMGEGETGEIIEDAQATPMPSTVTPVPGPTSTSMPTISTTAVMAACDDTNSAPMAEAAGPYTSMMGKGQGYVTLDGSNSTDTDGTIVKYEWTFGDNSSADTGIQITHGYSSPGSYTVTLTVTDNCGATSQDTAQVDIMGSTPVPNQTPTPTSASPAPTPAGYGLGPGTATMGFCHIVQYGDTLTGIAWNYGVSINDLALVNNVSSDYYVVAGESLFVPTGEIVSGPNAYRVQSGDTLYDVAYLCGIPVTTLAQVNGLGVNDNLVPGQVLAIPLSR